MISQRGRGRPKGDGVDDDGALMAIAVKLVSGEAQNYEEAAAAVYLTHKPARNHVRKTVMDRWRGKWHARGNTFLVQAQRPLVRVVRSSPKLGFTQPRTVVSQQHIHHYRPLLSSSLKSVMSAEQFDAQERERMLAQLNDPLVRPALARIQSGEIHSAFALFRKYQW